MGQLVNPWPESGDIGIIGAYAAVRRAMIAYNVVQTRPQVTIMPEKPRYEELEKRVRELEQAQSEHQKTIEDLARVFSMSLDMICIADINTATFLKVNPAFTETLGFSESELLQKPFMDFIHPDDIDSTRRVVESELKMGARVINFENRYRCRDGSYRWLSWVSRPSPEKGVTYAVARDITRSKQNEEALRKSKEILDATGRMAKVGGWELNVETLEVTWTEETYRIHEVPLDHKPPLQEAINFFHPEDRPVLEQALQRALKHGEPYDLEIRFITATGKHLWTRTICRPRVVDGKTVRLKGTFQDITDRKQVEERLKRSAVIIDSALDAIVATDTTGAVTYWNSGAEAIYGYDRNEAMGRPVSILYKGQERETLEKIVRRLLNGDNIPRIETTCIDKNGKEIQILLSVIILKDESGLVEGFVGFSKDITDRKQAETALKESEEKFRLLFDNSSDAHVLYKAGAFFDCNAAAVRALGFESKNQLLSLHPADISPECQPDGQNSRDKAEAMIAQAFENGSHRFEWLCKRTDNTDLFLDILLNVIHIRGEALIHAVWRDITEQKRAQEAKKESEERLQLALDAVSDAVWDWRIDRNEVRFNPGWYRMLGFAPYELPESYETWRRLLHPDDRVKAERTISRHLETSAPFSMEFRMGTRGGGWKWVLGRGQTVERDAEGKPLRMLGTNVDINARKQYESEREITLSLLKALHRQNDLHLLIQDVTSLMQSWSRCEAVGIRLKEGGDFPYFETRGFSASFVKAERYLCARDKSGEQIRDCRGNPVLECMCGNVICGRFNPELPFFTEYGSFYTNSTTALLASTTEEDRQARTRNRCNGEGYESVALIPLTVGNQRLGLLQFNDRRKGMFDEPKVALFERLASSLAVGLSQRITALALKESQDRYRAIFDQAADGILLIDPETGTPLEFNTKAHRNLGYARDEFKKLKVTDFEWIETAEDVAAHSRKLMKAGSDVFETKHKTKKGAIRDVLVSSTVISIGGKAYALSIWRDITEHKLAEQDREKLRMQLAGALEMARLGYWEYDVLKDRFTFNDHFYKIFRTSVEEVGKTTMSSAEYADRFVHPEDRRLVEQETRKAIAATSPDFSRRLEHRMIYADGTVGHISVRFYIVKNRKGETIRTYGVNQDITERKHLEARLAQAQKLESIGNLAGGIAHDFNNLLSPIVGLSELLLDDLDENSPEHENVREILKAGKRGSDLVRQILAFSRQSEQKKIPVRIQKILTEVLSLCRSTIPTEIEIRQEIRGDCGLVMADPTQIHQIAMNLMTNAFHALEQPGGRIRVQLVESVLTPEDLTGRPIPPGKYVSLTVSDTGCGIDPKIVDQIFEPYFTTKKTGKGTGLGLAVVYGIVRDHGGDVMVQSEVGSGTSFKVYLPLMSRPAMAGSEKADAFPATGNERILLVDDEGAIVKLEKQMLERLGYKVTTRNSSLDALEVFKARPDAFDIVITDMTMPNMAGDQLARELTLIRPDIPVIICTGFSERIDPEKAAAMGIKGLLMKPIVKSEMADMVRKALDQK